jgi:hypothetical protein
MADSVVTTVPGGLWRDGVCSREAQLRAVTGEDQTFLIEAAPSLLPAQWATEVLARCLTRLGPCEPVSRDDVRSLTVGDREALLLQSRRLHAGDRMPCVLICPSPDCGEKLHLDLRVADLLVPPYRQARERYEVRVGEGEAAYRVTFRLPNGFDQEAAAALARTDLEAAVDRLLRRCVESVVADDGTAVEGFPAAVRDQLPAMMAELDAQAEIDLRITCAACGGAFAAVFDTADYLRQEFEAGLRHLDHEVHLLAYHYHWSPSEILGMSARQRARYLRVLEEELVRGAAE